MNWRRLNIIARLRSWKNNVHSALLELQAENASLRALVEAERQARQASDQANEENKATLASLVEIAARFNSPQIGQLIDQFDRDADAQRELGERFLEIAVDQEIIKSEIATFTRALDHDGLSSLTAAMEREAGRDQLIADVQRLVEQQGASVAVVDSRLQAHSDKMELLSNESANLFRAMANTFGGSGELLARSPHLFINERGNSAVIVASQLDDATLQSGDIDDIVAKLAVGSLSRLFVTEHPPAAGQPAIQAADELLPLFASMPNLAVRVFNSAKRTENGDLYVSELQTLANNPFTIEAVANTHALATGSAPVPFDRTAELPRSVFPQVRRRSAVFLHNNYYHFNVLAEGLRKRGWDAMTVSVESPDSPQRQFYHGEDLNLFDPDYEVMREKIRKFLSTVPERFGALHFYGMGQASFFPENYDSSARPTKIPWDFFELRRHRMTIGYMPTGCQDGGRQSDIRRITNGLCRSCVWENRPDVCSDARATAWTNRLEAVCDWVGLECDWAVGRRTGAKYVRGPVVTTLDSSAWMPGLRIPKDMQIPRGDDEVLIYHAVGNYDLRRRAKRDLKGTGAVMAAIETLQKEGLPVRLVFFSDVPSTKIKYYQAQADIVVDQLRYGRYGANARECMMLGLPVVGWIDGRQEDRDDSHRSLEECPIVRANVDTVTDVLRDLVQDRRARERLSVESRKFAVRWHGDEACAERYEKVIDRIQRGLHPDSPDLYPPVIASDAVANEKTDSPTGVARSSRVIAARVPANRPPTDWSGGN